MKKQFNLSEKRWLFTFEQPKGYNYREEDIAEFIRLLKEEIRDSAFDGYTWTKKINWHEHCQTINRLAGEKFQ